MAAAPQSDLWPKQMNLEGANTQDGKWERLWAGQAALCSPVVDDGYSPFFHFVAKCPIYRTNIQPSIQVYKEIHFRTPTPPLCDSIQCGGISSWSCIRLFEIPLTTPGSGTFEFRLARCATSTGTHTDFS